MNVEFETLSYRHAEEILNSKVTIRREIEKAIAGVKPTMVSQGADNLTKRLQQAFIGLGWQDEFPVTDKQTHEQFFDFFKDRVAIEIEFSRYEFIYRDYFRFLSAYNEDKIDVGILITHSASGLSRVKHPSGAPSLVRVTEDLAWLRPVVTVPIWVVALK